MAQKKILHVLPDLEYSGVLSWLTHVSQRIDKSRFQLDFLVQNDESPMKDKLRQLGLRTFSIPLDHLRSLPYYSYRIGRLLREQGPYQAAHCHVGLDSWLYLGLAYQAGVPIRIAHSHTGYISVKNRFSPTKTGVRWIKRKVIWRCATHGFTSGPQNSTSLFGHFWMRDRRWHNIFCGIELAPFERPADRVALREDMGIPETALVVGYVGKLTEKKNPEKLITVFKQLLDKRPDAYLLVVGDGEMRSAIERLAQTTGVSKQTIFTGFREDAIRLMRDVMDVFLLPSLFEGAGLALVEAQAAGLPCVISDNVSKSLEVTKDQIHRRLLGDSDSDWANELLKAARAEHRPFVRSLFSRFDVDHSIKIWERIYTTGSVF